MEVVEVTEGLTEVAEVTEGLAEVAEVTAGGVLLLKDRTLMQSGLVCLLHV